MSSQSETQHSLEETKEVSTTSSDLEAVNVESPDDQLDGGFKAWTVLFGCACILYATYGLIVSNGLFLNYWTSHQFSQEATSKVAWITAIHVFLALFLGGQAGFLFDKYGHKQLLFPGTVLYIVGLFLTGECTKFWHFMLAYSVLAGTGCGLTSSVAINIVVQWFDKRRGLAMGIIFMSSSLGGFSMPFMMRYFFASMSWANCMRVIGSIVAFMMLIGNICARGRTITRTETSVSKSDFIDLKFISVTLGMGLFEFALFGTWGLLPEMAQHLDYSLATRFNIVAVINACSGLGRITCGAMADKIGCYNVITISASLSACSVLAFCLTAECSVVLLYLFAITFGFWSGSVLSIGPTCVAKLCKVEQYGQYYGTSYSITSFVNLICVPMGSRLLVSFGIKGFAAFFSSILVLCVISLSVTRWIVLGRQWIWYCKV